MSDTPTRIEIFYANLLHIGVVCRVQDGALQVGGNVKALSPVYRDEIMRRAELLTELLAPAVPEPLQPYMGRMVRVGDVREAQGIANELGVAIRCVPVNGGWIVLMGGNAQPWRGKEKQSRKGRSA